MKMNRMSAVAAALPLAAGLCVATAGAAQAAHTARNAVVYECEYVTLHHIFLHKPITGYPCTGPVGPATGEVVDTTTGRYYSCHSLEGFLHEGAVFVSGVDCVEY